MLSLATGQANAMSLTLSRVPKLTTKKTTNNLITDKGLTLRRVLIATSKRFIY